MTLLEEIDETVENNHKMKEHKYPIVLKLKTKVDLLHEQLLQTFKDYKIFSTFGRKAKRILNETCSRLPPSFKTWLLRSIFTLVLISYFCFTIYSGPILIIATTVAIQMKCYAEIINIGYSVYKLQGIKWFRFLSWYFLIAANYFCYAENFTEYFSIFVDQFGLLRFLMKHHRFLAFCIYVFGVILFSFNLGKTYDKEQFSLLAWTHISLLILVTQSYMIVRNIFQGLIWLVLPVSMVVCNDIMAYAFGFFLGKTPLIKVSPKKTWEGFIGGAVATIAVGQVLAYILCQYPYLICPVEYKDIEGSIQMVTNCEPSYLFIERNYPFDVKILGLFDVEGYVNVYPFVLHSFWLALFSSLIAPFGGFFASGFKRAFKVKDFGSTIPGHGGIMDRFDCQFLMATFVNVYITSFIMNVSTEKMFTKILDLKDDEQVYLFHLLQGALIDSNILVNKTVFA